MSGVARARFRLGLPRVRASAMKFMAAWIVRSVLVLVASIGAAEPRQAYVITGRPAVDDILPTTLFRVENGGLSKVRDIVTDKNRTVHVLPYYEEGYVFIRSNLSQYDSSSFRLDLIDLSSVATKISYDIELCEECFNHQSGPILKNGQLLYLVEVSKLADDAGYSPDRYWGIDAATGSILRDLDAGDVEHVHSFGKPHGLYQEVYGFRTDEFGRDRILSDGLQPYRKESIDYEEWERIDLSYKLPKQAACEECSSYQKINTGSIMLLESYFPADAAGSRGKATYVMNKKRKGWRELESKTSCRSITAFGDWLVTGTSREPESTEECYVNLMRGYSRVKLHFLNTLTDERFIHDVGMPGSQVLMIDEDDVVHLRMADELWRGKIQDGRLDGMEMIAKSVKLHHAHWMVLGHE